MANIQELKQALVPDGPIRTEIVTIGTAGVILGGSGQSRQRLYIRNSSAVTIGISDSSTKGIAAGAYPLGVDQEIVLAVGNGVVVYGIAGSTVQVRIMEIG